ncbi:MAG TPA: DUF1175 family protein [Pyrinomonadaceae bacterium]|nr:DUF1175 family protein [Pyrinomonadaceae bacterium]
MVALARSPENRLTQSFREMRTPLHATLGLLAAVTLSASACRQPRPAHAAVEKPAAVASVEPGTSADEDRDGLPDRAELRAYGDRENFRRWFAAVAEAQFYAVSPEWNSEQRDCAGLVRFALREALRPHDRAWFQRMGDAYEHVAPDVSAPRALGRGPLGEKLFRTAGGQFGEADLSNGALSEFADARTLKEHNAAFVGRDPARAEPGDLLFFHQPWVQKYPYHVMLFLGRARVETEGVADWLVYHTGSSPGDAGEVKKVRLQVLARHPDPRWRPVAANRNFLGFYRLNILQ